MLLIIQKQLKMLNSYRKSKFLFKLAEKYFLISCQNSYRIRIFLTTSRVASLFLENKAHERQSKIQLS